MALNDNLGFFSISESSQDLFICLSIHFSFFLLVSAVQVVLFCSFFLMMLFPMRTTFRNTLMFCEVVIVIIGCCIVADGMVYPASFPLINANDFILLVAYCLVF